MLLCNAIIITLSFVVLCLILLKLYIFVDVASSFTINLVHCCLDYQINYVEIISSKLKK